MEMEAKPRASVGFIGLGNMGAPMARRLLGAGNELIVSDIRPELAGQLASEGATATSSAIDVADTAETVLVSLPMPAIVEEVAVAVAKGKRIKRFVDLSTTGSAVSRRVHRVLAEHGIAHFDAPVSGGIAGATAGSLAVMVSGPTSDFGQVEPLLVNLGKVFFIGEKPGLAQTMKLANNLLAATALAATSEAVVMGVKAGIDPAVMIDVINAGSGRNSASQDKFPRSVLPRTFDFGFATGLFYKDIRLGVEEAEALGVPLCVGTAVKHLYQLALSQLGPQSDFTEIVRIPERWAGVEVGKQQDDRS
jgi:3-hydroxyisobutyrate dehydrogenase-like beta-hydroxyacid dehydrogenase